MDVAILGAGIDGLLAAHAVSQSGHKPIIYGDEDSAVESSPVGVYRHIVRAEVPGITIGDDSWYILLKPDHQPPYSMQFLNEFGYAYCEKVYGKDYDDYIDKYPVKEFEDVCSVQSILGWNVGPVYEKLWDLYGDYIQYQWVTPKWYKQVSLRTDFDLVLNTMPMTKWCGGGAADVGHHTFPCVYFWTTNDAPYGPIKHGEIYLSGDKDIPHYLQANVWGIKIVEWPENRKPPIPGIMRAARPLGTTCDCDKRIYKFINLGQDACWDHTQLIHDSYHRTLDIIEEQENKPKQLEMDL